MTFVSDYTALTTGKIRWNEADRLGTSSVVTYSFVGGSDIPSKSEHPVAVPYATNSYRSMIDSQRESVREALGQYETRTGLEFVEVDDPEYAQVKFLANRTNDSSLTSWAYFPETSESQGNVELGSVFVTISYDPTESWSTDWTRGTPLYTVILHEIGHSVGLEHPHDGYDDVFLVSSLDNHDHTIMSYDWEWAGSVSGRTRDTLAPLDIDALHYLYGNNEGFTASWRTSDNRLVIQGETGNDAIAAGRAASLMIGNGGNDRLSGSQFNDIIRGGYGSDTLDGGGGNDRLIGSRGQDLMRGGGGNDRLSGGDHNDRIYGELGRDKLIGNAGNDRMFGGDGGDDLSGGNGNDWLYGGSGQDKLRGGHGNDRLFGGGSTDQLEGGPGNDTLRGADGYDLLSGSDGTDRLEGGNGNDTLIGGAGSDNLWGQGGADVFVFRGADRSGHDHIYGWQDGLDRISITGKAEYGDFGGVSAVASQSGADVLIQFDDQHSVRIHDFQLSQLDAGDFIF